MRVTGEIYVPFKDITFIIDSDEPKLLQQIHIAEQGFLATISALDKCNEVRAGLLAKYPPENFNMQTGVGRLAIPEHEAYVLKNATDVLYKHVDVSLPIFDEQIKKISKFIECKFKGKRTGLKTASVESTPDPKSKE